MYVYVHVMYVYKLSLTITSCRLFSHLPQGLCSTTSSTSSSLSSPECSCWTSFIPSAILPAIFSLHSQQTVTLLSDMADDGRRTVKQNFRNSEDWVWVWVHNNNHIWYTYCLHPLSNIPWLAHVLKVVLFPPLSTNDDGIYVNFLHRTSSGKTRIFSVIQGCTLSLVSRTSKFLFSLCKKG